MQQYELVCFFPFSPVYATKSGYRAGNRGSIPPSPPSGTNRFRRPSSGILAGFRADSTMPSLSAGTTFLLLLAWHLVADVPLQPSSLAVAKRRPGLAGVVTLVLHGLVHGLGTGLILGSAWAVLAETTAHSLVDRGKCRGYYGVVPDQCAHLACLACWLFTL
jgi:hypothetical protein